MKKIELGVYENIINDKLVYSNRIIRLMRLTQFIKENYKMELPKKIYDHKGFFFFLFENNSQKIAFDEFIENNFKNLLIILDEYELGNRDSFVTDEDSFNNVIKAMREDGGFISYDIA